MKTELQETMTAGVFVEFHDAAGNTVGQALFADWHGRPIPSVGDVMSCGAAPTKLLGRVIARYFELQHELDGTPCVWVRLLVESLGHAERKTAVRRPASFSPN